MGSLIVRLDNNTESKLKNRYHYSDIDMLTYRGKNDEIPMEYDVKAVQMSVRNILMWRVGESVLRPQFGHKLHQSMYSQLNGINKEKVCSEIKRALEENEPRISIKAIDAKRDDSDEENNTVHVRVVYTVVGNKGNEAELVEETIVRGK